jgi:hypothetical protein
MNFLAHFLLAPEYSTSDFRLGSVLPDLARRAGIRILPAHLSNENAHPLEDGIRFHWNVDLRYHNSTLFSESCGYWKNQLDMELPGVSRKFFLYHLLAEMWLDRVILIQNPDAAAKMYQVFQSLEMAGLESFSSRISDSEGKIRQTVDDFNRRQFVSDYSNPEKFAAIASGVFCYVSGQQEKKSFLQDRISEALSQVDFLRNELFLSWVHFRNEIFLESIRHHSKG